MRRPTLPPSLFPVLLAFVGPTALTGQEPPSEGEPPTSVVVRPKSAFLAGAIESQIPIAGYAYAGEWNRGIPSALVRVTGLLVMFADGGVTSDCGSACAAGAAIFVVGTVWATFDAAATARRTNERHRGQASLPLSIARVPGPDGPGWGLGMRIATGR